MSAKTIELLRHSKNLETLLKMSIFAALMPLLLKCYSLERVLGMITPNIKGRQGVTSPASVESIVRLGVLLLKRNRLFLKNSCLNRSLLLYYFLRKDGIEVQIHFGVKKLQGYLTGHSWLTQNGNLLIDKKRHVEDFTTIISYPESVQTIKFQRR